MNKSNLLLIQWSLLIIRLNKVIRFFDFILSLVGLVILAPLFIVLSVWIKIDSIGPVFYKQIRVGQNGKDFGLFKFRSMVVDADKKGLITVGGRDPRITRSGYFIRKYKLDELPQLINVLVGDMSLVGPRPEVRKYVDLYTYEQQKVLSVKPGITDYASIEYMDENMPEKIKYNMKYIKNRSLIEYFKIIFLTVLKIIR